jgi:hypothetical protein|tara:strand:+ start:6886 stop:7065 length:180 start_codon:yes stop_codon:yes gene_type:complete
VGVVGNNLKNIRKAASHFKLRNRVLHRKENLCFIAVKQFGISTASSGFGEIPNPQTISQ